MHTANFWIERGLPANAFSITEEMIKRAMGPLVKPGSSKKSTAVVPSPVRDCPWPGEKEVSKSDVCKHFNCNHLKQMKEVCPYPGCGKIFPDKSQLGYHQKRVHAGIQPQLEAMMPQIIEIDDLLDKTPWMIDETYPNFWAKPVLLKGKKNWNNNFVPAPLLLAQLFRDSEGEVLNPEESDHTTVVGPVPGPGQEVILPCKMKFSKAVVYVDDHPTTSYAFGFPANMWATVFRQMGMPGFVTTSWVAHQHMRRENLSHPKLFYGWTGAFTNLHNDFGDGPILICCLTRSKMVVMFPPTETVEEKLKAQRPEWVRRGNIIIPMEAPRDQNTKLLISSLGGCSVNLLPGEMVVIPPLWLHSVTCTEDKTLTLSVVLLNEPVMDLVAMSFSRFPFWFVVVGS